MKQFLLLLTLAGLCAMAQTTVLDISFTPEQMKDIKLPDCAKIDVIDGNPCLAVTSTDKGKMNVVEIPFDYSKYSDYSVAITVRVKYSDVTQPKDSWNGTKIQATFHLDSGRQWKNPGGSERHGGLASAGNVFHRPEGNQKGRRLHPARPAGLHGNHLVRRSESHRRLPCGNLPSVNAGRL